MARFLITGGAGFIGSHLAKSLLADNHQVRVIDDLSTGKPERLPSEVELVIGDIRDGELIAKVMHDVDGCFHLAAVSSVQLSNEDWLGTHQTNLSGTINIFDAARPNRTPVVYASSAAVYGDNAEMPLKETSAVSPLTAYGADKLGSEQHARVAGLVHGVPTMGMRFFNVYGPEQDPSSPYSGVISIFVDRLLRGKAVSIYGDGDQTRDFIFVDDVVTALRKAMRAADCNARVMNVSTGSMVSIRQLVQSIMSIVGVRLPIEFHMPRKGDIRASVGDPTLAHRTIGFKAQCTLLEGLRALTIYEQNKMKLSEEERVANA